jgi:hypothetical protein
VKKKVNEKEKRIGENVEECEVKGHGFWPSLTPQLSLFLPSLSFAMGLLAKRRSTKRRRALYQRLLK